MAAILVKLWHTQHAASTSCEQMDDHMQQDKLLLTQCNIVNHDQPIVELFSWHGNHLTHIYVFPRSLHLQITTSVIIKNSTMPQGETKEKKRPHLKTGNLSRIVISYESKDRNTRKQILLKYYGHCLMARNTQVFVVQCHITQMVNTHAKTSEGKKGRKTLKKILKIGVNIAHSLQ